MPDEIVVRQNDYERAYEATRAKYPFGPKWIGKRNPYNGQTIHSEEDYLLYLQMHIYTEMCKRASGDLLRAEIANAADLHRAEIAQIENKLAISKADHQHSENRRVLNRFIAIALAVALLITLIFVLPSAKRKSYDRGYTSGEDVGYASGYDDGETDGYSSGYDDGETKGYMYGYEDGSDEGYEDGYSEGVSDGVQSRPDSSSSYSYIGNANTGKFHETWCSYLPEPKNRVYFDSREDAISYGCVPCAKCDP